MVKKKEHLLEKEIQRLERMTLEDLATEFAGKNGKDVATTVRGLLVAYRLAARVANRAFAFVKEPTLERGQALESTLSDYAPENFSLGEAHDDDLERAELIAIYEEKSGGATADELREALYQHIEKGSHARKYNL